MLTKINFHGINISDFTEEELWSEIDSTIHTGKQMVIYWRHIGSPSLMKKTPGLLEITNNFDILLIDGRGLYLFMKMMGQKLKNELYTSWFTLELLKKAAKNELFCHDTRSH
jgi:UDP-N-acetyl-D-mannosaminuronic acid transferase (WecB/TagA/CpsF family)